MSAARTTSSVSGLGNSSLMSTPSSVMASTTAGLICSPGSLPADRTWIRPSERSLTRPAAIWLRPELCTHTNSTSGCSLTIMPSACPSAFSRSRAKRCASTGTNTLILPPLRRSVDSAMKRAIVSCEKMPANSVCKASAARSTCPRVTGSRTSRLPRPLSDMIASSAIDGDQYTAMIADGIDGCQYRFLRI